MLIDNISIAILDFRDGDRVAVDAAGRQRGIGLRHLHGRHALSAERDRWVGREFLVYAHVFGYLYNFVRSDADGDLGEAGVG